MFSSSSACVVLLCSIALLLLMTPIAIVIASVFWSSFPLQRHVFLARVVARLVPSPSWLFKASLVDGRCWAVGVVRCGRIARASFGLPQRRVTRGCRFCCFVFRRLWFQLSAFVAVYSLILTMFELLFLNTRTGLRSSGFSAEKLE